MFSKLKQADKREAGLKLYCDGVAECAFDYLEQKVGRGGAGEINGANFYISLSLGGFQNVAKILGAYSAWRHETRRQEAAFQSTLAESRDSMRQNCLKTA